MIQDCFKKSQELVVSVTIPNLTTNMSDAAYFLLNPFLERSIFFYHLKRKNGEQFHFNTKSCFYNFEEYLIDRVEKYNREWYKSQSVRENKPNEYEPPQTIPP